MGFGVLAGVLALALGLFLLGIKRYRVESPTGSPFTGLAQVLVAAARKWRLKDPRDQNKYWYGEEADGGSQLEGQFKFHALLHTDQYRLQFLP